MKVKPVLHYTDDSQREWMDKIEREELKFTIDESGNKRITFPSGQNVRKNLPMSPTSKSTQLDDNLRGTVVDVSFTSQSGITISGRIFIGEEPKAIREGDNRMWIWHEYVSDDNEDIRVREALTKNINYNHLTIVQHNPLVHST